MKISDFVKKVEGDLGLEIELEAENAFPSVEGWRLTTDGSLRNGVEYISPPLALKDVLPFCERIFTGCKNYRTKLRRSQRAGVHAHLNITQYTVEEVFSIICFFYLIEKAFVRACGEDRMGNYNCLVLSDAEALSNSIIETFGRDRVRHIHDYDIKYSALNLANIPTLGTIEFRCFPSNHDAVEIEQWCKMLVEIRDRALKTSLTDLFRDTSAIGVEKTILKYYGANVAKFINGPLLEQDFWCQFDVVQEILYHVKGEFV